MRLVAETRGRGRAQRVVSRLDVLAADGTLRRVRTVGRGALSAAPAISPDRRRVAFSRVDGRIAIVTLRGGALRLLTPPGLPRPRPTTADVDLDRWTVYGGADVSWSPDGRTVVAHDLVVRVPTFRASTLGQARSVACTVASGRCTSAGPGAPADLIPLAGGRTLRLDGPTLSGDRDGDGTTLLDGEREERLVLAHLDDPERTAASLGRGLDGTGGRVLRALGTTARRGVVALGSRVSGPAGALVRRGSVAIGPQGASEGTAPDGAGVDVRTRTLTPWTVSPSGRLGTLPLRLGVTPIGSLADGRWLLPSTEARATDRIDSAEPGLATLDRRGRVAAVRVGGRPVTPVRLALDAGLPDTFAAGASFTAAWPSGGDLLVQLGNDGFDGLIFFPGDSALVRLPLDGRGTTSLLDHEGGASYAVR